MPLCLDLRGKGSIPVPRYAVFIKHVFYRSFELYLHENLAVLYQVEKYLNIVDTVYEREIERPQFVADCVSVRTRNLP
jgi:hypothetical protein